MEVVNQTDMDAIVKKILLCLTVLGAWFLPDLHAQAFVEDTTITNLPTVGAGTVAWGDYDTDGDLDIVLVGGSSPIAQVFRNDGGAFVANSSSFVGVNDCSVGWADFDANGSLDLAIAGYMYNTRIYSNSGGVFSLFSGGLPGAWVGGLAWGDYDNDGDYDLLYNGLTYAGYFTKVCRQNSNGSIVDMGLNLPGSHGCGADWGDYDNDGDLDILIAGDTTTQSTGQMSLFENINGAFSLGFSALPGIYYGGVEWGDYDSDGDLDILMVGIESANHVSRVYRNVGGGNFINTGALIAGLQGSNGSWADIDNDGDLDILEVGSFYTYLYRNDAGSFVSIPSGLPIGGLSVFDWGDYDNDGDLDLIFGKSAGAGHSRIFKNTCNTPNTPPSAPTGLTSGPFGNDAIHYSWNYANDAQTPQAGITYRLWIGTDLDSFDVCPPMADTLTGYRTIPARGHIQRPSWTLKNVVPGVTYFACVSAIDGGWLGSPCSNKVSTMIMLGNQTAQWTLVRAMPNPTRDFINVSLENASSGDFRYSLKTIDGREIPGFSGMFSSSLNLDLSGLAAGVFLLKIDALETGQAESLRIIKEY